MTSTEAALQRRRIVGIELTAAELGPLLLRSAAGGGAGVGPLPVDLILICEVREPSPWRAAQVAAFAAALLPGVPLIAEEDLSFAEPFAIAREIATLDILTGGRAGVLLTASTSAVDARARGVIYREDAQAPGFLAEAASVLRALWGSWEPDAVIRDAETARFVDAEKIHLVDHRGEHLRILGPSATPASPQRQPPILVEAGAPDAAKLSDDHRTFVIGRGPEAHFAFSTETALRRTDAGDGAVVVRIDSPDSWQDLADRTRRAASELGRSSEAEIETSNIFLGETR